MYNTDITNKRWIVMSKTIPMIISNRSILIRAKDSNDFVAFSMPGINLNSNIPFYHMFAQKISECQYYFKQFMRKQYGKNFSKYILAIITPDDTTPLESIFINEFFINSGACKAVAQIKMSQALSKTEPKYISISMSCRNVIATYINNNEIIAAKCYDCHNYDATQIIDEAKKIHIDVECDEVPIFINNLNVNMEKFFGHGQVIAPKEFLEKIAVIDVEKL